MSLKKIQSIDEYTYLLTHDPAEPQALVEILVIPETWFFRYPVSFEHMTSYLVNNWFKRNPGGKPRILSVPCSTGEEPYTIAMSLLAAGIPAGKFQIDAVDISRHSLESAKHAIYGRNSFRGTDLGYRDRYFVPLGEDFVVRPQVKDCVKLICDNLLSPGFSDRRGVYDVVFCRNLLIYFDDASRKQAATVLTRSMQRSGILYLGHAENMAMVDHGFKLLDGPHAFACVRPDAELSAGMFVKSTSKSGSVMGASAMGASAMGASTIRKTPAIKPVLKVPVKPPSRSGSSGVYGLPLPESSNGSGGPLARSSPGRESSPTASRTPNTQAPVPASPSKLSALEEIRSLADQGRHRQAIDLCEKILKDTGPSADVLCMLGILHQADGRKSEAEKAFNKALYLDHQHYDALLHLALLYEKIGEERLAENLMRRAQRVGKTK